MEISARTFNEDQEKTVKANNIKTSDHISELPDDILTFIMSFLTMRDASRSRVLSCRWRHLLPFPSNLHFDPSTLFGIKYDEYNSTRKTENLWECKFRFVIAVDQLLQLNRSPKVHSFGLHYCLGNESACHIERWIDFAVIMKTEKLDLNFSFIPKGREAYNFPCHLLRKASHLKHLLLQSCNLSSSLDFTNHLDSLKTIELKYVCLKPSALNNILSGCRHLDCLRLEFCGLTENFSIHGPNLSLKKLVLHRCFGANNIQISSIDLVTFEYFGGKMTKLWFHGVPFVKKVHLMCLDYNEITNDLPQMQSLSLFLLSHQRTRVPVMRNKLAHLKELELIVGLVTKFDLLSLVSILNGCPYLLTFRLELRCTKYGFEGELVKWRYPKQLRSQLKKVEISGFCDKRSNSLELAIYLLRNAVELERMVIGVLDHYELPTLDEEKKRIQCLISNEKVNPNMELIVQ